MNTVIKNIFIILYLTLSFGSNVFSQESDNTTYKPEVSIDQSNQNTQSFTLDLIQQLIRDYKTDNDFYSFKTKIFQIEKDEEHETYFFQGFIDFFYEDIIKVLKNSQILLHTKKSLFSSFKTPELIALYENSTYSWGNLKQFSLTIWKNIHNTYFPERTLEKYQANFDRMILGPSWLINENTLYVVASIMIYASFDKVSLLETSKDKIVNQLIRKIYSLDELNKGYVLWAINYLKELGLFDNIVKNTTNYYNLPVSKQIILDVIEKLLVKDSDLYRSCIYILNSHLHLNTEDLIQYYKELVTFIPDNRCQSLFKLVSEDKK